MAPPTIFKLIGPGPDSGSTHSSGILLTKITICLGAQQHIVPMPTSASDDKKLMMMNRVRGAALMCARWGRQLCDLHIWYQ